MEAAGVFYNREDLWQFPRQPGGGGTAMMAPYYIIMRLPGEPQAEFFLMIPMVPSRRDNIIAWLAARCDPPAGQPGPPGQDRLSAQVRPVGRPAYYVRRCHASFSYQAGSWSKPRHVIAKVEWHPNPRLYHSTPIFRVPITREIFHSKSRCF